MPFVRFCGQPMLHALSGEVDGDGVWIELTQAPLVFGRGPPKHPGERFVQRVEDIFARRHFVIEPNGDGWQLRDLGSSGGTWVNRERIGSARVLCDGDLIWMNRDVALFKNERGGER